MGNSSDPFMTIVMCSITLIIGIIGLVTCWSKHL